MPIPTRSLAAVLLLAAAGPATRPADPPIGHVSLVPTCDADQPAGWPIVVRLKMTNTGATPIYWWCGGPDTYPEADHFAVTVYDVPDGSGRAVQATNGQYTQGSGVSQELAPGGSVEMPLAFPLQARDQTRFSITTAPNRRHNWQVDRPAEGVVSQGGSADPRRADVIAGVVYDASPFLRHLAEQYPDPVVTDALVRLAGVDNPTIAGRAVSVLARIPDLPATAGEPLAAVVDRWASRSTTADWRGLGDYACSAALNTRAEAARGAVLRAAADAHVGAERRAVLFALETSPGDDAWLRRARDASAAVGRSSPANADLRQVADAVTHWLDSRLAAPRP